MSHLANKDEDPRGNRRVLAGSQPKRKERHAAEQAEAADVPVGRGRLLQVDLCMTTMQSEKKKVLKQACMS